MAISISELYKEALKYIDGAAEECQKDANVDLTVMMENCQQFNALLQSIQNLEINPVRQNALTELAGMGSHFTHTLSAKIGQLEIKLGKADDSKDGQRAASISAGNKDSASRRDAIEDTIVQKGGLTFDDIAGLAEAKATLKEAIIMPVKYPQLFTGGRRPWKRILLYGPPGTGKSRLAQAVSSEIKSVFYSVSSSDLVSSWVGESEKLIKELFASATTQEGRSVIFIDEVDSICRRRSSREEEHTRRIKTELLKQMEGAHNSDQSDKIFLLCATNCPWEIDSAFLRRFQKRIYIPLPDRDARISLIKLHCKDNSVPFSDQQWAMIADKTNGFSGSDIASVVLDALFQPIRDMAVAKFWCHSGDNKLIPCDKDTPGVFKASLADLPPDQVQPRDVTVQDFCKTLTRSRKTVNEEDLRKFDEFTTSYGQNG